MSVCLSVVRPPVRSSVRPSVRPSVCSFVFPYVCIWVCQYSHYWPFQGCTSVVVRYCYLFLLSVGSWMTTCLEKSCSFGLPRVPFINCCQFMYLVISFLVLRTGYGIWLYQCLIIAYLFTLFWVPSIYKDPTKDKQTVGHVKCGMSRLRKPDRDFLFLTSYFLLITSLFLLLSSYFLLLSSYFLVLTSYFRVVTLYRKD